MLVPIPALEANDNSGMRFRIRAIKAGKSKNNAYYPDQVLREATPLFNGVRVFAKADAEHLAGGGKSFANLIGRLTDAQFVEGKAADGGGAATPAGRRGVDSVSFPSIVWAALATYIRSVEQHAVMRTHDPS